MTDIQAAVGRVQLGRLPRLVERAARAGGPLPPILAGPPLELPEEPPGARSNWQSLCVRLPDGRIDRQRRSSSAWPTAASRRGRGPGCAHREPAYASEPWRAARSGLAQSERPRTGVSCSRSTTTSARSSRAASSPRSARRSGPDARPDQRAWLTKVARSRSSCSSGGSRRPGRSGPRWRCRSPSSGTR